MKQLTNKEMVLLGTIGYILEDTPEIWEMLREKVILSGCQAQLIAFHDQFESLEHMQQFITLALTEMTLDILGENDQEE